MGAASTALILTMAYFSLFNHPLREDELLRYCHFFAISPAAFRDTLGALLDQGILVKSGALFHLRGDDALPAIRGERETRAATWRGRVARSASVLTRLPFLRGLFLSGSLSKGTQDERGDIDFLLVTAGNRLWTTRFFASLLLKSIPKSGRRNFCMNYFLPEDRLGIPDRTLFSATEVAFLKPLWNTPATAAFFEQNSWFRAFYPNLEPAPPPDAAHRSPFLQRLLEWPLSGRLGDRFEAWATQWFIHRITHQVATLPLDRSPEDFRIGPWEYKGHTKGFHGRLRNAWHERLNSLEATFGIRLIRWPWGRTPRPGQAPAGGFAKLPVPLRIRRNLQ